MMTMIRIRTKRTPEAEAAIVAAHASHARAQRDLAEQQAALIASRRAIAKLREHDASNGYAEWFRDLVARGA